MATKPTTLGQLLIPGGQQLPKSVWSTLVSNAGVLSLKTSLEHQFGHAAWAATLQSIPDALGALLDVTVLDIIAQAWNKYRVLSEYMDRSRYKPEDIILKPLMGHTIRSVHRPYLEVSVDHAVVGRIEFEVTVTLKLEGAVLKIQNGRILEIRTGSCQGAITLALEKVVLAEMDTGPIPLPGAIPLGEGGPQRRRSVKKISGGGQ